MEHSQKNKIAIEDEEKQLTFKEVDFLSNLVSDYIQQQGISKNSYIGLKTTRSCEMVIAILGTLKAGCAYIPISPFYPQNRIDYIINTANIKLVLSNQKNDIYAQLSDIMERKIDKSYTHRLPKPNDTAYVIFTSGTTGNPKGVEISHLSLTNRLTWMHQKYNITHQDIFLQKLHLHLMYPSGS